MPRIADGAMYPRGSVTAAVLGESALLAGGPRALLMQLAHPSVAAGVADHSGFDADPFGRLVRTLDAMNTIAFGSPAEAAEVLARLQRVHGAVEGRRHDGVAYSAGNPALLLWVHATLVDTVLEVESRYLGMLSEGERDTYYVESLRMAAAFGIPSELVPPDRPAFADYMAEQVRSLEISPTARALARAILHPRVFPVPAFAWEPLRLVTIDMLPRAFREGYGLTWDRHRKRVARSSQAVSRVVLPRVPAVIRNFPDAARRSLVRAG